MRPWNVEIIVKGALDTASEPSLHDAQVVVTGDITSLRLATRDAASMYAILNRLQASGCELLAVHRTAEPPR